MGEIYRGSFIRTNRVFMRPIGHPFDDVKIIDDRSRVRSIFLSLRLGDNFIVLCNVITARKWDITFR